jgi:V/A-type H+-transporting ATPase subunit C
MVKMYRIKGLERNPVNKGYSLPRLKKGIKREAHAYRRPRLSHLKAYSEPIRYGYAVGRIKVLEMKLLSSHRLKRLIEADFEEALHILEEVEIGDFLVGARVARDVDSGLTNYLRSIYSFLEEILPEDSYLVDFFLCRYDFHNLKVLLKSRMDGKEEGLLPGLGRIEPELLRRGLEEPSLLPPPYRQMVEEAVGRELTPQQLDTLVDVYFLRHQLELAEREGNPFLKKYVRTAIDFANLKALLRGRNLGKSIEFMEKALVEGGELKKEFLLKLYTEPLEQMARKLEKTRYPSRLLGFLESADEIVRLTDFDRRADDYLMGIVRRARRISVGVEPIFAYVRARENEVTILRILLMGKLHNLSPASIEKMLRKLYIE